MKQWTREADEIKHPALAQFRNPAVDGVLHVVAEHLYIGIIPNIIFYDFLLSHLINICFLPFKPLCVS